MVAMTSQDLKTRVVHQLQWDDRVDASDIGVTIDDGYARLTGTVSSYRSNYSYLFDGSCLVQHYAFSKPNRCRKTVS